MTQAIIEEKALELILLLRMKFKKEVTAQIYEENLQNYFKQDVAWKILFNYIMNGNHASLYNNHNVFVNKIALAGVILNNKDPFTLFDVDEKIKEIKENGSPFNLMQDYSWMLQNEKIISLFSPEQKGNFLSIALYDSCIAVVKTIIKENNWKGSLNINHIIKGISSNPGIYLYENLSDWMSDHIVTKLEDKDKEMYNIILLLVSYFNFKYNMQLKISLDSGMIEESKTEVINKVEIEQQIELSRKSIKKFQNLIYWEEWDEETKDFFIKEYKNETKIEYDTLKYITTMIERLEPLFLSKRLENTLNNKENKNKKIKI